LINVYVSDKFIPFKTPLDSRYDGDVPEECRFDVGMLMDSLKLYRVGISYLTGIYKDIWSRKIHQKAKNTLIQLF